MCESVSLKPGMADGEQQHKINHESVSRACFFPFSADPEEIRAGYLKKRLKNFIARLIGSFSDEG